MAKKPAWLDDEEQRSDDQQVTGNMANTDAPVLVQVKRAPTRKQKPFYIQDKHAMAFEALAFKQKQAKGKRAPELAEEAIELLLVKYGEKLTK